jgi:hypothetical protein
LRQKKFIQKLITSVLLVLFIASITPKNYFHDLIADHKDVSYCDHPAKTSTHLHQQGYNCNFDDLVVTVPYLLTAKQILFLPDQLYTELNYPETSFSLQAATHYKETRGPPSA